MKNELYESRDFYGSAYLMASGVPLKSTYKTNGMTTFVFENTDRVSELLESYYGMQAIVNPALYAGALKNLKSIIHSTDTYTKPNTNHEHSNKGAL